MKPTRTSPPAVLLIIEAFLPDLTGAATQAGEVVERLCARGHPVTVLTRRNRRDMPRQEVTGRLEVRRLGPVRFRRWGKYLMLPGLTLALLRRLPRADVVLVCSFKVTGGVVVPLARLFRRPSVLRAELNGELDGGFVLDQLPEGASSGRRLAARLIGWRNRLLLGANAWIHISRVVEAEYRRCGVPDGRMARITNGIDVDRFQPADESRRAVLRRELGLPPDAHVLSYTGRLSRGKGLETLLEAFAELARTDERAHLLLVGSGAGWSISIENDLRRDVERRGLESRVTFAGHRHDVEAWLEASNLFTFLSEDESLGISLIEAQACALPVVATRVGGIPDVVEDGVTGLLIPPQDPAAAVAAIRRFLDDPAWAARVGRAGRRRVEELFAIDPVVDRYQHLFARLAGEWRTGEAG
jgi:glycosyltransferase involved in cell wall biosynthesis